MWTATNVTKMKPKISLKSLLLLLSAITEASSGKYRNNDDRGIIYDYANSSSLMPGNITSAVDKECHDFNQIARWINLQVVLNGKVTRFNQRLGKLLVGLNNTAPVEHCCFYEKTTMKKIVDYLNSVAKDQASSTEVKLSPLKLVGELGQDLDNILAQMGKLIKRDIKSCCDQLAEGLKKQKADLGKNLEELRRRRDKANGEQGKAAEELRKKQADQEEQLADLREQMEKIEEKLRKSGEGVSTKCCAELGEKLQDLEGQAKKDKTEAIDKAKKIDKKLEDLTEGQKDQDDRLKDIQKKMDDRLKDIASAIDMCKENCGNGSTGGSNASTSDLETRVEALRKLVEDLSKRIADLSPSEGSSGIKEKIKSCQEIGKLLATIETMLQQAIKGQNPAGESADSSKNGLKKGNNLEKQVKDLQIQVDRSRHCCKFLDGIGNDADNLSSNVEKTNKTYTDHISDLEKQTGDLKKWVDEALEKIKALGSQKDSDNGSGNDDLLTDLDRLQQNLDNSTKDIENLQTQLDNMMAHIAVLTKTIKDRFAMTEDLNSRLLRLEEAVEDLRKDIDKTLKVVQRIKDLEKLLDDALDRQQKLEIQVKRCLTKCKAMDSIDDLIDRIEDLEREIKPKTTTTENQPRDTTRATTRVEAWVGGIDVVTPFVQPN
ncbi:myosin heavy chain, striated muscle [Drosophila miranda]|uniref:myosin heavy chain, striated muscle n=1 Tax=Drosophila miranda TaxID=7229 RepID=UPI0007E86B5E|nr:myosin heavy chain, striated muscle [Drosophila miranda]